MTLPISFFTLSPRRARRTLWLAFAGAALAATAHAQDLPPQALYIGGTQGSSAGTYTYAGQIVPLEGARVGQGWFRKNIASWLTYRYDTTIDGLPVEARAAAPGLETGVGYAWDGERFKGDASISLGVRHTRLRPHEARATGQHGTQVMLTPQVAARYLFSPRWDADALASYSLGAHSLYARTRVGVRPEGTSWRLGLESSLSRGRDYRTVNAGVFAGRPVGDGGWFVELNAGRARPQDGSTTPYIGLSVSLVR